MSGYLVSRPNFWFKKPRARCTNSFPFVLHRAACIVRQRNIPEQHYEHESWKRQDMYQACVSLCSWIAQTQSGTAASASECWSKQGTMVHEIIAKILRRGIILVTVIVTWQHK